MGEIGGLAAVVGAVVTGLVAVIGYLLADQRADRKQYEAAIGKADERADRARVDAQAAWAAVEEARHARHVAEDALAELRRARGVEP